MISLSTFRGITKALEKSAKDLGRDKSLEDKINEKNIKGLSLAGGGLLTNRLLLDSTKKPVEPSPENADLTVKMLRRSRTPVLVDLSSPSEAAFDLSNRRAIFGIQSLHNPAIVAHELGHGEIERSRLGRIFQNRATAGLGTYAPHIGIASGVASGLSDNENVQRAGLLAPVAMSAPQLGYEAVASLKGLRRMRRAGASKEQIRNARKTLAAAWGTYGTRAAVGAGSAYAGQASAIRSRALAQKLREAELEKEGGLRENFEEKLDGTTWKGAVNSDGYPKIKDNGELRLASHVALELAGRKGPGKGQIVMHRDNNPKNLDLSNLRVGTQRANLKQMRDEGRDRPRGVDQEPDVKKTASIR